MIYMRSKYDGFDIVVNDCYAHNGANKRIQLIDEYGWASYAVTAVAVAVVSVCLYFILTVINRYDRLYCKHSKAKPQSKKNTHTLRISSIEILMNYRFSSCLIKRITPHGIFFSSFFTSFHPCQWRWSACSSCTHTHAKYGHFSCPVDDKLISRFRGSWSNSDSFETQVYAYMKTFRFTGSPALYIECDVRMCHGRCPVSKTPPPLIAIAPKQTNEIHLSLH